MLLFNGKVYTQDPQNPWVDSLLIDQGEIIATGTYEQLIQKISPSHEKYDLENRLVLPGFVDSHLHLELYSAFLSHVNCETPSRAACLHRIMEHATGSLPGEWLIGHGWNHNQWPEGIGNKEQLDEVSGDHPAYFTSKSVHSGWANSTALRIAGIDSYTPDPSGGVIVRDSDGNPTGILLENAMNLVERVIPQPDLASVENSIHEAQNQLVKMGITSVHDFDSVVCLSALQSLHDKAELKIRVVKGIPLDYLDEVCEMGMHTGFGDEWLQIGSVKLFADGALGSQTAAMLQPYNNSTEKFGIALLTEKELVEIGQKAIAHQISVATHAIGDAANRTVVNAYTKYRQYEREHSLSPLRHRIEHVQIIQPEDLTTMKQNQIIASMQPVHAISDWKMADEHWGSRVNLSYAWKSVLDQGIELIFGSDAPVESPNPFLGLYAAITRKANDFEDTAGWCPNQRISLEQAVYCFTFAPAIAVKKETHSGKLAPGFLADLVVLDNNIFEATPEQLRTTTSFATMVAGHWVWKAE